MSWPKLILELLSLWQQVQAHIREAKRNEAIKQARKNPTAAFNDHFGGLPDDTNESNTTDKAEH